MQSDESMRTVWSAAVVAPGLLQCASAFVARWPQQARCPTPLQSENAAVIDVGETAVVEDAAPRAALGADSPYPCVVENVELVVEAPIDAAANQYLVKGKYVAPGAAVMYAFDEIRAQAKDNLAEPGFRPGDIPPWIKTQMVEFSLTTVMEDLVKFSLEADGMDVLPDAGADEGMIKWDEDPAAEAKTFVLGSSFTFHAAFNVTLPDEPVDAGELVRVEDLYKITDAMEARANKIKAAGGKIPSLMNNGGGGSKKGSKKTAPKKKKKAKKSR